MYLEEIVENIQLESDKFECKAKLNRDDAVGWLKTIAGFANACGGEFYIGVEDKTNKLIGFDRMEADNERNYFNNQVNEQLVPRPQMTISFIRYKIKEKERFVIRIQVRDSIIKPVILKYENIPSIFMRRNGFTNAATYEESINMCVQNKNIRNDENDLIGNLSDLTYVEGVEDSSTPILTFIPAEDGTDYDDKVLSFCYYQAHKVSEIAEYLGISDSTYLRKQVLGNLEKQGYLESGKIARAMYFKTNRDMVRIN